jgi:hypothetical protein
VLLQTLVEPPAERTALLVQLLLRHPLRSSGEDEQRIGVAVQNTVTLLAERSLTPAQNHVAEAGNGAGKLGAGEPAS